MVYMGILGYTRVYMGIQGYTRVYRGVHGYTWVYMGTLGYTMLLNSKPRIMHFAYSDWFTQSWLSAHIPWFDLIW